MYEKFARPVYVGNASTRDDVSPYKQIVTSSIG